MEFHFWIRFDDTIWESIQMWCTNTLESNNLVTTEQQCLENYTRNDKSLKTNIYCFKSVFCSRLFWVGSIGYIFFRELVQNELPRLFGKIFARQGLSFIAKMCEEASMACLLTLKVKYQNRFRKIISTMPTNFQNDFMSSLV